MVSEQTIGFEPADTSGQGSGERAQTLLGQVQAGRSNAAVRRGSAQRLLLCLRFRRTPRHVQAALLGAIAYFILPFDFIPDMLPVLGFTDDAAVLATAIRLVAAHITPEHHEAARAALKRIVEPPTAT